MACSPSGAWWGSVPAGERVDDLGGLLAGEGADGVGVDLAAAGKAVDEAGEAGALAGADALHQQPGDVGDLPVGDHRGGRGGGGAVVALVEDGLAGVDVGVPAAGVVVTAGGPVLAGALLVVLLDVAELLVGGGLQLGEVVGGDVEIGRAHV